MNKNQMFSYIRNSRNYDDMSMQNQIRIIKFFDDCLENDMFKLFDNVDTSLKIDQILKYAVCNPYFKMEDLRKEFTRINK